MPDDRISLRQLLTLTFAALLSPAIQVLPGLTARRAGVGGWLATLAALPVLLGLCWVLCRLFQDGLPDTALKVLGPVLGRGCACSIWYGASGCWPPIPGRWPCAFSPSATAMPPWSSFCSRCWG